MKNLRRARSMLLAGWFVIFTVLLPVMAQAETINATSGTVESPVVYNFNGVSYSDTATLCEAVRVVYAWASVVPSYYSGGVTCKGYNSSGTLVAGMSYSYGCTSYSGTSFGTLTGSGAAAVCQKAGYVCPTGQNWTLSGTTCTRPDCTATETRNASTGICEAPVCPTTSSSAWYATAKGQSISGTYCTGGCEYTLSLDMAAPTYYTSSKKTWLYMTRSGDGKSCTGSTTIPEGASTPPNTPEKAAPCAAGEGVISNSTGKVSCVPSATPGADTLNQTQKSSTQKFDDGSTKVTTTTNTCTGEGACSTNVTTTITSSTAGTAGQAGTPGTSTKSTDSAPSETSDFCAKNPSLQFCKGGMNEEATQKAIATELQAASAAEMTDQAQRLTDAATENKTKSDALEEQIRSGQGSDKNLWFSWVWTPPVGSCQPSQQSVHGVGLSLDYCSPVALIRDIVGWLFAMYGAWAVYGQLFRRAS